MTIDLVLLFNTAYAFEQTAFRVPTIERRQKGEEVPLYSWEIAVALTNSALALELYLKALWAIERDSDPPRTHRLDRLFDELTPETKGALAEAYSRYSSVQWTVEQMLVKASHLFQESRYPHEYIGENYHRSQSGSYELAAPHLFRERILELRPELDLSSQSGGSFDRSDDE
jgi:HEPN domain-containing protein